MDSSKNNVSIDFDAYQEWRKRPPSSSQPVNDSSIHVSGHSPLVKNENNEDFSRYDARKVASMPRASAEPVAAEARYPTSFSHIVELITSGQPVPGIKDIPDIVLSGQESTAATAKRKKPWEQGGRDGSSNVRS